MHIHWWSMDKLNGVPLDLYLFVFMTNFAFIEAIKLDIRLKANGMAFAVFINKTLDPRIDSNLLAQYRAILAIRDYISKFWHEQILDEYSVKVKVEVINKHIFMILEHNR